MLIPGNTPDIKGIYAGPVVEGKTVTAVEKLPPSSIIDFKLLVVGEGIEVEEKSFSEEVASQVNNTT